MDFIKKATEKPAEALATAAANAQLHHEGQFPEELNPDAKTEAFLVRRQIERQKRAAAAKAAAEAEAKRLEEESVKKRFRDSRLNVAKKYVRDRDETVPALNKNLESWGLPMRMQAYKYYDMPKDRTTFQGKHLPIHVNTPSGVHIASPSGGHKETLEDLATYDVSAVSDFDKPGIAGTKAYVSDFMGPAQESMFGRMMDYNPSEDPRYRDDWKTMANPYYLDPNAAPDRFKEVAPAKIREGANALKGRVVDKLKKLRGGGGAGGGAAGGGSMPDKPDKKPFAVKNKKSFDEAYPPSRYKDDPVVRESFDHPRHERYSPLRYDNPVRDDQDPRLFNDPRGEMTKVEMEQYDPRFPVVPMESRKGAILQEEALRRAKARAAEAREEARDPDPAIRKIGRGGGGAGGGSAGGGGGMPDVDEVREEEYTQGGPDYAAEDELDKYARLDRAYKGEYTSPESQAQAEKVAQLQADAVSEGEPVEHEAAETSAQEASEEDGYEEEGEVIPDDDMTAPPQDSPQSLVNERAAAIGESLGAGAEEAGAKTETQKLDEYIRQSVKDYYESRGMKYEDLFAKSEPKAKPAAAPARRGPAVQRAETVTTSNGGQRQSDLAREAEYLRGRTEPPPPPPPPKPPVVPKPQATPGPFDADISEALDRSSMRHRPSDTAAIAAAQEAERNPATVGSAVGSQKTAEAVEAMERSNEGMRNAWKSVLPIGGALGGLAYGAYRAKRAADTASEAGKAGAEAFRQALRMGEGQAPVRSGVRVGEGVVEAAARPTRVARSRALPAGSAAPPAAGAAPRSQSQALQRAPVEAEFVPEGPVGALPGGATRRLLPEGHTSASRPATTQPTVVEEAPRYPFAPHIKNKVKPPSPRPQEPAPAPQEAPRYPFAPHIKNKVKPPSPRPQEPAPAPQEAPRYPFAPHIKNKVKPPSPRPQEPVDTSYPYGTPSPDRRMLFSRSEPSTVSSKPARRSEPLDLKQQLRGGATQARNRNKARKEAKSKGDK